MKINYLAVIVTAFAALCYVLAVLQPALVRQCVVRSGPSRRCQFGPVEMESPRGEIVRTLVIAYVLAHVVSLLGVSGNSKAAISLAIWLWLGSQP